MQTKPHSHTHAVETEGDALNNMAPFYDKIVNLISLGKEKKIRKETIALAQVQPGEHVLDVGCGTGSLALAAAQRVGNAGKVAGIDPAPKMIEIAQRKAAKKGLQADFRVGVIEKLPYPDNSFDVVLSSLMMHHLPDHLKSDGIAETYRVLKPGGRLA
ncbi:MAG: methyltransferase domain-containing protein, partial [Chloroflexi bacterium]|nr:methyltransferase domain-containing protein [Chloroflexota bacterium]